MTDTSSSVSISVRISNGTIPLRPYSVVAGSLDFEGFGSVVSLPEGLTVEGNLHLRGTSIQALPKGLRVFGFVELEGCKSLKTIDPDVHVGGDLDLEGCASLGDLPDDLEVGGDVYLFGTRIHKIPASAVIRGQAFNLT